LPAVCADVLSPALEAELARVDPADAHLYVERLEISLSGIDLDRLEAELVQAVRKEIADYFRRHPPAPPRTDRTQSARGVELRTMAWTINDALVMFLRSGRLPWSFLAPPGARFEQLVLDAWTATAPGDAIPPAALARLAECWPPHARAPVLQPPGFVRRPLRAGRRA
jgi:hypothetical protein